MIVDLPPPPAPVTARIEASLPAASRPYEHLFAGEGETLPEGVPVRQLHGADRVSPVRADIIAGYRPAGQHARYASASPIQLVLDRLGFYFRALFPEIRDKVPVTGNSGGEPDGLGDGSPNPVPAGDPIPVGGGGRPNGG